MRCAGWGLLLLALLGCGSETGTDAGADANVDGSRPDGAVHDSSVRDGATPDASADGGLDAGLPDAGLRDAGIEIDECADGTASCPSDTTCVDIADGYRCACPPPRAFDGSACVELPPVPGFDTARFHSCVIDDGAVRCFGLGRHGQLGTGAAPHTPGVIAQVVLPAGAVDVATADTASCAVLSDGRLFCWGRGPSTGIEAAAAAVVSPTEVELSARLTQVALTGGSYGCALAEDGQLWCWGQNVPALASAAFEPIQAVGTARSWRQLLTGMCGITETGTLECWRGGRDGGFEDMAPGLVVARATARCVVTRGGALFCRGPNVEPTDERVGDYVRQGERSDWIDVSEGPNTVCTTNTAGVVHCWGPGYPRDRAQLFADPIVADMPLLSLEQSQTTVCARPVNGPVHCWGDNAYGQVGRGTAGFQLAPTRIGDVRYASVSGGTFQTCALRNDGRVDCFGEVWEIGYEPAFVDEPTVHSEGPWAVLAAEGKTRYMASADGSLHMFGVNPTGTPETSASVEESRVGEDTGWTAVAVESADHACGVRSGQLYCWGRANDGQTGDPSLPGETGAPSRVGDQVGWTQVSVGPQRSCAIRAGELYCFGFPYAPRGELIRIGADLGTWTAVAMADDGACGVADGRGYCWGNNLQQQRVYTGPGRLDAPTAVDSSTQWRSVVPGALSTCGVRTDGTLHCWGENLAVDTDPSAAPRVDVTQVGVDTDWRSVLVEQTHVCGLRTDGALYCWGRADHGAVGNGLVWYDEPAPVLSP